MATEGRTVLVSSHQMGEMSVTADHLVIIGEGRLLVDSLLVDSETEAFQRDHGHEEIHLSTPDPQALRERIAGVGGSVRDIDAASFAVSGWTHHDRRAGPVRGRRTGRACTGATSLEDAFMELTAPSGREPAAPSPAPAKIPT
jgi:ABC-2 type transport system ATP-binding protein